MDLRGHLPLCLHRSSGRLTRLPKLIGIASWQSMSRGMVSPVERFLRWGFKINLTESSHAAFTMKHAIPLMAKQGGGSIVNVASVSGKRAQPAFVPYSTSKVRLVAQDECCLWLRLSSLGVPFFLCGRLRS